MHLASWIGCHSAKAFGQRLPGFILEVLRQFPVGAGGAYGGQGGLARVCAAAAVVLVQAMSKTTDLDAHNQLAQGLTALAARLEPKDAADVAATLTWPISKTNDRMIGDPRLNLTECLTAVLNDCERPERSRRAAALASTVGIGYPVPTPALIAKAVEPLPWGLSTQQLVDLFKLPTCQDPARRVILDQLGIRYGRRFDTHWDFIRFAQEKMLNLDLTTAEVAREGTAALFGE
jgi:hypothetical protein